ncbi:MAG TPA: RMD1 family protein, partial [bacterium]|nr:RMD1 family protein [bacterium]
MKILAYDTGEDINFNTLIAYYSTPQITRWEDPLIINFLQKSVHIFRFGPIVFFGHTEKESLEFIIELEKCLNKKIILGRVDDIEFEIEENPPVDAKNWSEEEFYFNRYAETIYFNKTYFNQTFLKIISFALSQSVALERFDKLSEILEEDVEKTMNWFKKYKSFLPILSNKLFDKTIKILKTRHTIISDI